uniref:DUF6824 domain-containing protein n=1 Tax=Entomoneis paludosa TaxID=265537 RepID=A0A7S3DQB0_9STRA|mmetsp:Transcript_28282/g.59155  ORF Transcript_28282/g.59155 Transcript_28282/m.59155 type:complete len:305 (+) Transcript_28282:137-1051(+)|eukprot:CAMPEP_0172465502 /NCGR_PEP_ID=MMETSP1065-20121228/53660_1 /TAXON_ID=265537 /ORGANISM="Amphiprora paludosa, Strain CCMP125" /LENGTH=304 /DNA_ID=CAMNT_0013222037 /DNA_START=124 /DNA_END=1038 /DNA_ORIENTATION=-
MSSLDGQDIGYATDVNRLDHIPTQLKNLPSKMPRNVTYRKRKSLPPNYQPGEFDVCCGRGKRHWNHMGNVRFRRIIQTNVERYIDAPLKNDKTAVVVSIVDDIRNFGGYFLKEDLRGNWYDIGDQQAREKVGHSLRDQVSTIQRQKRKEQAMQLFTLGSSNRASSEGFVADAANPQLQQQQQQPTQDQILKQQKLQNVIEIVDTTIPEEDEDALSDGENEMDMRRSTLKSSAIIERFGRRPSFASSMSNPHGSISSSNTRSVNSARMSSKRSSGWSFLNELDFSMDNFEDYDGSFEPIAYTSGM